MPSIKRAGRLVETIEAHVPLEEDELLLRVEIFQDLQHTEHYWTRIWRIESYRLQSTFPQENGVPAHEPSDELIFKEFEGFEAYSDPLVFRDLSDARGEALARLTRWAASLEEPGERQ